jgi:5-methyltetrahydrofolate--homocysteine methyltransferase
VLGVQTLDAFPLDEIARFIDWTPLFQTWELAGRYPAILDDAVAGEQARELFADARRLLDRIIAEKSIQARGVYGLWPANAAGDDIEVYRDDGRDDVIAVFHTLRQQSKKAAGRPNLALSDFIAPRASSVADWVGGFAVTAGIGLDEMVAAFERRHDDYNSIMAKALADRLAEAFAECLHQKVRKELWGYSPDESLDGEALIREKYRGIRPAPGYPAYPDHTEKGVLFDLLDAERRAGIRLTESFAMLPASSVSGLYFSHPDSQYFGVGKIERDQVDDYARRKGIALAFMEKWLSPNLAYEALRAGP